MGTSMRAPEAGQNGYDLIWIDWGTTKATEIESFDCGRAVCRAVPSSSALRQLDLGCASGVVFDIDGAVNLKLVAWFKTYAASLPLILIATEPSAALIRWAMRNGVRDVLARPMSASDIQRTIDDLHCLARLRHSGSRRHAMATRESEDPPCWTPAEGACRTSESLAILISRYVAQHLSEPIRAEEVADICGCSQAACNRALKESYGNTLQSYIMLARIERAAGLLRKTTQPIGCIAWHTGFHDAAYFSRMFKRIVGTTPKGYREGMGEISWSSLLRAV